jgi:predicted Fe-Mo cluster-binding NifX family protein
MKIAVTAKGDSLSSEMDERFGRCAYFIIVDTDNPDGFQAIKNDAAEAGGGAGVRAAQTVIDTGAEAVVSGNFGPKAFDALSAADMKLYAVSAPTVRDAVDLFRANKARPLESATAAAHAGLRRI